jgi:CTP synthase (UTP-ammonia lyase)
MHPAIRIALVGDYNELQRAHQSIPRALSAAMEGGVETAWISTDSIARGDSLANFDGIWCVPGMPYRNPDGAISAIRFARTGGLPFLGTSAGFQYALIEFARNVLGFTDADHQKSNPKAAMPLISPLGCGLAGVKARVKFASGSHLHHAYRTPDSVEEYHCSFGLNNRYRRLIESGPMTVTALDDQHEVRAVELDGHPFFVATLFQPEMRDPASPLVAAFTTACRRKHEKLTTKAAS